MKDPIVQEGAEVLRKKAHPVLRREFGTPELRTTILKMKKALKAEKFGVAIAAPQVGISKRIFVVAKKSFQTEADDEGEPEIREAEDKVFINPEITRLSRKKVELSEGCLSVRGKYGTVIRHAKATVKAFDEDGAPFVYHGSGLLAHIFQHETDHLDGILYIDKAETLRDDPDMDRPDEE